MTYNRAPIYKGKKAVSIHSCVLFDPCHRWRLQRALTKQYNMKYSVFHSIRCLWRWLSCIVFFLCRPFPSSGRQKWAPLYKRQDYQASARTHRIFGQTTARAGESFCQRSVHFWPTEKTTVQSAGIDRDPGSRLVSESADKVEETKIRTKSKSVNRKEFKNQPWHD